jgi:hypothetical protein
MEIRGVELGVAARPNRANRLSFHHPVACRDSDGAQVEQGDGEPLGRSDRDRSAVGRQRAGKRHATRGRGRHDCCGGSRDVDSGMAVLAVLLPAELEPAQHLTVRRPRPRLRRYRRHEQEGEHQ